MAAENAEHDASLDAEIARIETEAEVRKAALLGQHKAGGATPASTPADGGRDHLSWDDFWAEVERKKAAEEGAAATTVIRGVEVVIPHDLPLRFDRLLEQVEDSDADEDVHSLVADLFGEGVFDQWIDAGMGSEEFRVVLMWGIANGRGRPLTFAEAYEAVQTEGKSLAPPKNRTDRRASARSGGRSKQTSGANTGSPRRR